MWKRSVFQADTNYFHLAVDNYWVYTPYVSQKKQRNGLHTNEWFANYQYIG